MGYEINRMNNEMKQKKPVRVHTNQTHTSAKTKTNNSFQVIHILKLNSTFNMLLLTFFVNIPHLKKKNIQGSKIKSL